MSGYGSGYSRFGSPFGYNPMSGFNQFSPFNQMGGYGQMGGFGMYQPYQPMYAPPMFQNPMFQSYSPFYQPLGFQQMPDMPETNAAVEAPPPVIGYPTSDPDDIQPYAPVIGYPTNDSMTITAPDPISVSTPPQSGDAFMPTQDDDYGSQMTDEFAYRTAPQGFAWSPVQLGTGRGDQQVEYRLMRTDNLNPLELSDMRRSGQLLNQRPANARWSDFYNRQALASTGKTKDSRF